MNVLFVSNGETEDAIAISLIRYWLSLRQEDRVAAWAISGSGENYRKNDIPIINQTRVMPSCGFAYQDWKLLWQDYNAGLVGHLIDQVKAANKLSSQIDYIVAVGDIVPVIACKILNKPNAFIGCAMSDYYVRGKGKPSSYSGLKRKFLKKMNSIVFPRDRLTTENLLRLGIRAEYQGNPVLDCIEYSKALNLQLTGEERIIGVLPGSHSDSRENFRKLIALLEKLPFKHPLTYFVAVSKKENVARFGKDLGQRNWFMSKTSPKHSVWQNNKDTIHLLNGYFGNILLTAHVIIGTSGTGNEQAAGIGVPVISMPLGTIQYTPKFAEAQKRLLGPALAYIPNTNPAPDHLLRYIRRGLEDVNYREKVKQTAEERFGDFGASERIVHRTLAQISPELLEKPPD